MLRPKNIDLKTGEKIFKALSDESRIRIVHLMYHTEEICISDIELILDYTQTKTSRHLAYLRSAGLVKYKKIDQWVYYSLHEVYKPLIKSVFIYFDKETTLYKDLLEYRTLYANNELAIRKRHIKQKVYKVPEL
jgi:ArsR family transcriptional regulator